MSRLMRRGSLSPSKTLFGVDGCRGGWVLAGTSGDLNEITLKIASDTCSIFEHAGPDSILAIDIPIGIPENEPRECDVAARQLLRWPRSSSVFSPPCRSALLGSGFEEVLRLNRAMMGLGISKQAFHIMPKIREVDGLMTIQQQRYIREVHPEVTFAQLNGGPLSDNKKSLPGRTQRIALLRRAGLSVSEMWLNQQRAKLGRHRVFVDDIVDALACLVTAVAIKNGSAQRLGRRGQRDAKGLLMEIVTCELCVRDPLAAFGGVSPSQRGRVRLSSAKS